MWRAESYLRCKIFRELKGVTTGSTNPDKGMRYMLTLNKPTWLMTMGRLLITLGKAVSEGESNIAFVDKCRIANQ